MILIIDNYDLFTYNLVDIVSQIDEVIIKYPDDKDVFNYLEKIDGVIISPGPGHPLDDDELVKIIDKYHTLPILGICLGAQALTCYYGGKVIQGEKVMHGKVDTLEVKNESELYLTIPHRFRIMRYHSLVSEMKSFPKNLIITEVHQIQYNPSRTNNIFISVYSIIQNHLLLSLVHKLLKTSFVL